MVNFPGPGDPETWPSYSGHPNDPRAPADYGICPRCLYETSNTACLLNHKMCEYCLYEKKIAEDEHLEMEYEDRYESI